MGKYVPYWRACARILENANIPRHKKSPAEAGLLGLLERVENASQSGLVGLLKALHDLDVDAELFGDGGNDDGLLDRGLASRSLSLGHVDALVGQLRTDGSGRLAQLVGESRDLGIALGFGSRAVIDSVQASDHFRGVVDNFCGHDVSPVSGLVSDFEYIL